MPKIDPRTGRLAAGQWGYVPPVNPTITRPKLTDAQGRVIQQAGNLTDAEIGRGVGRFTQIVAARGKAAPKAAPKKKKAKKKAAAVRKAPASKKRVVAKRAAGMGKKFL